MNTCSPNAAGLPPKGRIGACPRNFAATLPSNGSVGYGGQSGNHAQAHEGKYRGSIASNFSINRFRVFAGMLVLSILGATVPSTAKGPIPAFAGGAPSSAPKGEQTAVLAGGCFWGVYAVFRQTEGC